MNKPIVEVKEKKYSVDRVSVVLKLNSGPLIHLSLSEKLDGTESKLSNEESFKQEFLEHIYKEDEGSFEWQGTTLNFILVGYNSTEARTFELVGLVVKKKVIDWFNENNFKDKKQDYFIYQKSNGGNSWPFFDKVLGEKFEPPNQDFKDKIKFLFPENGCIWRYRDSNNFHFLNRTIAFTSRHLPEVQGWCAFDSDKPLRLILFEEKKQDNSIPKLDSTWNASYLFLPNRYSWNRWLDKSCTLSRELDINADQKIALIKQLVSDGSNGEDAQKGKNFQAQNPTRLLFVPGTINIGDRNIFCHTVSYEFKLPTPDNKDSPSVTMKIELDYPERQIGDNEVVSLRLSGKFQTWEKEKDEETKVKIAPPDINNWGIIDEKDQTLKSGDNAVLYTQILSPTYSDKKYSGIYIKHEKDDEMIVDIHPCGIPLVLGSVQKYRPELEKADITLCGEKLAISVSSHSQSLASAEAIILDNSEIKLNHGKKIFGQAQQKVDLLSQNIELGSSQIEINSGQTKINSLVNVSFPSPKVPTPNVSSSPVVTGLASGEVNGASNRSTGSDNSSPSTNGAGSSGDSSSNNNVNSKGKQRATLSDEFESDTHHAAQEPVDKEARAIQNYMQTTGNIAIRGSLTPEDIDLWSDNPPTRNELPPNYRNMDRPKLRGGSKEKTYEQLMKTETGKKLIDKANELNVQIKSGHYGGRAFTARGIGEAKDTISIYIPNDITDEMELLTNTTFELNNAIRQKNFDDLQKKAEIGEVPDAGTYAQEKIKIEIKGMLATGRIGMELRNLGVKVPIDKMYTMTYLDYLKKLKEDNSYKQEDFAQEKANEILNRSHGSNDNNHRKVYENQYNDLMSRVRQEPKLEGQVTTRDEISTNRDEISTNRDEISTKMDYTSDEQESMDWTSDEKEIEELSELYKQLNIQDT